MVFIFCYVDYVISIILRASTGLLSKNIQLSSLKLFFFSFESLLVFSFQMIIPWMTEGYGYLRFSAWVYGVPLLGEHIYQNILPWETRQFQLYAVVDGCCVKMWGLSYILPFFSALYFLYRCQKMYATFIPAQGKKMR